MLKLSTMPVLKVLQKLNHRNTRILPKFTKLSKIVFFSLILLLTIFTTTLILAESENPDETIKAFVKKQDALKKGNNQESWMSEAASSNTLVAIDAMVGPIDEDVLEGKETGWVPGGLIGLNTKMIASLYNLPFSGIEYLASVKNNFLGKPAHAQGIGFQGFSAFLPIWKGFRNATYAIFSLFFVVMGIMIMLRVKISQQAVLTVQNALPKIITALILVTFSYAIVGLLIDFSYVIESLGLSLIYTASGEAGINIPDIIKNPNVMFKIGGLVSFWTILKISGIISGIIAIFSLGSLVGVSVIAFGIILLLLVIIILIFTLKFFFGLLKCYINIIIKTIIGPLEIALGAIPNMKMGFGSWFTGIIANILVFPISMIFLVMVKTLMDVVKDSTNLWSPPGLELFSGGKIISMVIGLGGLMILSKLPSMIPEFIFQIKPSPFGKAIGEGFKGVATPIGKFSKSGAKAGLDYADKEFGDGDTKWQKTIRVANKMAGGRKAKVRAEKDKEDDDVNF
jgi:hypothetical protein